MDAEEAEEDRFCIPEDFDDRLKEYLDQVSLLRTVYRRGIGFRLTSSKTERFYAAKTRRIERAIPNAHDLVISVPDKVLWEALQHGILTDLGITLFVRIDTKIGLKRTQGLFPLMGLHDYGHSTNAIRFARFLWAYAPYLLPGLASVWPRSRPGTLTLS